MGHPAKLRPAFVFVLLQGFGVPGRYVEYLLRRWRTISVPPTPSQGLEQRGRVRQAISLRLNDSDFCLQIRLLRVSKSSTLA
jgi:hypothetical protein